MKFGIDKEKRCISSGAGILDKAFATILVELDLYLIM